MRGDNLIRGFRLLSLATFYADVATPIACGLGLWLMSSKEGRHPDPVRGLREVTFGAGIGLASLGLFQMLLRFRGLFIPWWLHRLVWQALSDPWVPLVVSGTACA